MIWARATAPRVRELYMDNPANGRRSLLRCWDLSTYIATDDHADGIIDSRVASFATYEDTRRKSSLLIGATNHRLAMV